MYRYGPKRKWVLGTLVAAAQACVILPAALANPAGEAPAQHHARSPWPQASLSAEASTQVAQDTVTITLAAELDGASQAKVAGQLSDTLGRAMKQVSGHPGVKASTGNVRVWPVNDNHGRISGWHGRAEIVLKSTDFKAAAAQAAKAGDGMAIANLQFSVSRAARAKAEQALLAEASQAFRARAQALASAFGFASYSIRNIELGGSGAMPYQPAPRMMAMAAASKAAPVPLEGTTETVTVSVHGSIFLHSTQK
jgi:predicted secreted protein